MEGFKESLFDRISNNIQHGETSVQYLTHPEGPVGSRHAWDQLQIWVDEVEIADWELTSCACFDVEGGENLRKHKANMQTVLAPSSREVTVLTTVLGQGSEFVISFHLRDYFLWILSHW